MSNCYVYVNETCLNAFICNIVCVPFVLELKFRLELLIDVSFFLNLVTLYSFYCVIWSHTNVGSMFNF